MRWPLVLFAGALAACGLQPRGADISLEGGSIIGSVVKRAPVLTIVVPSDVQTKGFDSATPVLGDVPTYIVQGDRYRINIDLAKLPLDVSKLVSTQVAERNAY